MSKLFQPSQEDQNKILEEFENRHDPESERIRRYLSMPDLTRLAGNPLAEMVKNILAKPEFKDFDVIETPEVVPVDISFDLFDFPKDHPARSKSDTYYVDDNNILRT